MKKAIVVGGSNGIGLAIAKNLISKGYHVYIFDIQEPDETVLKHGDAYTYIYCNLLNLDEEVFAEFVMDEELNVLMITAGFGRVADFEYYHTAEIQNTIQVNVASTMRIVRTFFERIKSESEFYCGIMGSIAGWVSSPMFAVYAASKAAICRFIESVNIEIEYSGIANRILNVSPGSIKGTKFNGGENVFSLTNSLAEAIIEKLFNRETLYIPEFDEIYKGVLQRYNDDSHQFGLSSYEYKKQSGRACNESRVKIGYLSGTFDLFHVGHLNLLKRAKAECDYLIVGVHPDASHKGKETFIPYEERKAILSGIKFVDKVVPSCPEDSDAWELWHYSKLFVGSDYKGTERFLKYEKFFENKGVEIVYFPYTQGTSSTQIRKTVLKKTNDIEK